MKESDVNHVSNSRALILFLILSCDIITHIYIYEEAQLDISENNRNYF